MKSMLKKLMSVLLAIVVACSFSVSVFADDPLPTDCELKGYHMDLQVWHELDETKWETVSCTSEYCEAVYRECRNYCGRCQTYLDSFQQLMSAIEHNIINEWVDLGDGRMRKDILCTKCAYYVEGDEYITINR